MSITSKISGFAIVLLVVLLQLSLAPCCSAQSTASGQPEFPSAEALRNSEINYKLIRALNNTWGYDIYMDNKLVIHQAVIPGMQGNMGFKSKEAAGKVADAVIKKMKNGQLPPSISIDEMKKMNVL